MYNTSILKNITLCSNSTLDFLEKSVYSCVNYNTACGILNLRLIL